MRDLTGIWIHDAGYLSSNGRRISSEVCLQMYVIALLSKQWLFISSLATNEYYVLETHKYNESWNPTYNDSAISRFFKIMNTVQMQRVLHISRIYWFLTKFL